jgi:hypothetical protein
LFVQDKPTSKSSLKLIDPKKYKVIKADGGEDDLENASFEVVKWVVFKVRQFILLSFSTTLRLRQLTGKFFLFEYHQNQESVVSLTLFYRN